MSVDNAKSWRLAAVTHRTAPNAYGKHWGWVWWELEVPIADLLTSPTQEIMCRAWDSCQNTQPNTFTWVSWPDLARRCCQGAAAHRGAVV